MKKINITILTAILLTLLSASSCYAGWLIFHKPEYRGRLIDAETKEPIEGAVVVAMYRTQAIIYGPAGDSDAIIRIKEALTDENGEFVIPSYMRIMGPTRRSDDTRFIIYKPGYGSYPENRKDIHPFQYCGPAYLFSKQKLDSHGEIRRGSEVVEIKFGVVELPRLKTREERLRTIPSPPTIEIRDIPLFYEAINKEYRSFGLKPVGR